MSVKHGDGLPCCPTAVRLRQSSALHHRVALAKQPAFAMLLLLYIQNLELLYSYRLKQNLQLDYYDIAHMMQL